MKNKKLQYSMIIGIPIVIWFYFTLPNPLFNVPYSNIIDDVSGELMGATTAADEQWRFPVSDSIPNKFEECILQFEDAFFYYHPGINPIALFKAFSQNIQAGKIIRGGSTLSMQVIRLSRQGQPRTYMEKLYECILALRLELKYSKKEILSLYSAHAPFGGNVVGLEAASWRYFGRPSHLLSWGETATLAVLPNAPSLIFPGKNEQLLLTKRNKLIDKLVAESLIDEITADLAKSEPLPGKPKPLPQLAPHLLATLSASTGLAIQTTIDSRIQTMANQVIKRYASSLKQNEIHNAAVLIADTKTGEVKAYVGNTTDANNSNENAVDIIQSSRSSGSTLKPFLFRNMLHYGQLLSSTILPDIPTYISGYSPKNFDEQFDGAVHADKALARSLNVPAVRMLQDYGVDVFLNELKEMDFSSITKSSDHYGLSLILGGAEVNLWDLVKNYRRLALGGLGNSYLQRSQIQWLHVKKEEGQWMDVNLEKVAASWLTLEALKVMDRPIEGQNWQSFASSKPIAWKTGTSFGHKDAWTVGVTPDYIIGVWVGNADGEGRPGLTGASTAAPIMFRLFEKLPGNSWFPSPQSELVSLKVCSESGYKASSLCTNTKWINASKKGRETDLCPFHKLVFLDESEQYQVNSDCYEVSRMVKKPWFVLPPIMEWYYASKNPYYQRVPPYRKECTASNTGLDIIYPRPNAKIFIPRGFNGKKEQLVFEAAYRSTSASIHWHLDNDYLQTTTRNHQIQLQPEVGKHTLTLVTEEGEMLIRYFEVVK